MIRIRSVALGLALLGGSAAVAGAQSTTTTPPAAGRHEHGGRGKGGAYGAMGGRHGMMGGRLFKGIDLTADQKTRIQQIGERYRSEFRALHGTAQKGAQAQGQGARRERPQLTPEQRQQMQALRQRQMTEVRGVLTAEQQKQFDANVADMKARRDAHQKEHGARSQKQG